MNEDFLDILRALCATGARFLVVGAHALAGHGVPRATGALDLRVETAPDNIPRIWQALAEFGAPVEALRIRPQDFAAPGAVVQIGLPPRRIDLMTSIAGVDFGDAWTSRVELNVAGIVVPVLGRECLIANKQALARPPDLADVYALSRADGRAK